MTVLTLLHAATAGGTTLPVPKPVAPPGVGEPVGMIFNFALWAVYAAAVIGFLVGAFRLALNARQHGDSSEGARSIVMALIGAGLAAGGYALISALMP
ncbi:hypothetical protein [Kineosporia sp. A_224]|uniref:hypothetical protein n=1 Tax=Kineosporia sp. A_224 TaxID=1962180 RepID=UPI00117BAE95|nr:hypothetical protein [Kineosporia sp. A_224]